MRIGSAVLDSSSRRGCVLPCQSPMQRSRSSVHRGRPSFLVGPVQGPRGTTDDAPSPTAPSRRVFGQPPNQTVPASNSRVEPRPRRRWCRGGHRRRATPASRGRHRVISRSASCHVVRRGRGRLEAAERATQSATAAGLRSVSGTRSVAVTGVMEFRIVRGPVEGGSETDRRIRRVAGVQPTIPLIAPYASIVFNPRMIRSVATTGIRRAQIQ